MQNPVIESQNHPPRLVPSLAKGFNAVAGNIYIILIPIAIDIFLWFGPMFRVRDLLLPVLLRTLDISAAAVSQDTLMLKETTQQLWTAILEGFNLLFGLRTYPIGVPSLMISQGAQYSPLGSLAIFEMTSINGTALFVLLVSAVGILLGSVYFSLISAVADESHVGSADESKSKIIVSDIQRRALQSAWLSIILLVSIIAVSLPLMCVLSGLLLALPSLGMLPFTLFGMLMVWMLMPLAFSPHGIFTDQLKVTSSIVASIRMVRSLMSPSGLFLMIAIMLSYGLDILWSTPGAESWMMIVGIIGHAFIASGLLASSFVFYRDGMHWMGNRMKRPGNHPNNSEMVDN